jgi:hypothetical protein
MFNQDRDVIRFNVVKLKPITQPVRKTMSSSFVSLGDPAACLSPFSHLEADQHKISFPRLYSPYHHSQEKMCRYARHHQMDRHQNAVRQAQVAAASLNEE